MTFRGNHVDELISVSLTGDLTDAERVELDAHLVRCETCRATLAAFTAERRILSGLPVADPPRDLSARGRRQSRKAVLRLGGGIRRQNRERGSAHMALCAARVFDVRQATGDAIAECKAIGVACQALRCAARAHRMRDYRGSSVVGPECAPLRDRRSEIRAALRSRHGTCGRHLERPVPARSGATSTPRALCELGVRARRRDVVDVRTFTLR